MFKEPISNPWTRCNGVERVRDRRVWSNGNWRMGASVLEESPAGISEGIVGKEKEAVCWVLSMCVKVTVAGSLLEWGSRSQIAGGQRKEGEDQAGKLVFTMF